MATAKSNAMQLQFPFEGLFTASAAENQSPLTTPACQNVRPVDSQDGRLRGGQRPGLSKAYAEQIGNGSTGTPVILMGAITVTYLPGGA